MPTERFISGLADSLTFGIEQQTKQDIENENRAAEEAISRAEEDRIRLFEMGEAARDDVNKAADRKLKIDQELIRGNYRLRSQQIIADSREATEGIKVSAKAGTKVPTRHPTNRTQVDELNKRISFLQKQAQAQLSGFLYDESEASLAEANRLLEMRDGLNANAFDFIPSKEFQINLQGTGEDEEVLKMIEGL